MLSLPISLSPYPGECSIAQRAQFNDMFQLKGAILENERQQFGEWIENEPNIGDVRHFQDIHHDAKNRRQIVGNRCTGFGRWIDAEEFVEE